MRRATLNTFRIAAAALVIAWAALAGYSMPAHAESVFRCRGADGALAFQDRPCGAAQSASVVEIGAAPASTASPDYGRAPNDHRGAHARVVAAPHGNAKARHEAVSYECRAANGELFYRHSTCPKQIPGREAVLATNAHGRSAKGKQGYAVSAQALPRAEACRRITSGGAREGHERDDRVSTYDRNLGRDPCRYL